MNVILIGSGGREHALALSIAKSPLLRRLYAAPGNPGIAEIAETVVLDVNDDTAVVDFCRLMAIDLVVVGPEAPLVAGLADVLRAHGIACFGPGRAAAQLEGSKAFTKAVCDRAGVPTAAYGVFTESRDAHAYLDRVGAPIVVKADGLAAGKGVVVAQTLAEARAAIDDCFAGAFGTAGATVVIEEMLTGEEASFFALCDGERAVALGSAQDHKRVGDGDTGANTGGMGAYSPAPIMTRDVEDAVMARIIRPTLAAMREAGAPFSGCLFAGLMIGADGPKLIEYNARFGDPETQVILPRLAVDLLPLLHECATGSLAREHVPLKDLSALTVVLAARGYPAGPLAVGEIRDLDQARRMTGVTVTHAGTKRIGTSFFANGGRVLNVTGVGATLREARDRAYAGVAAIDFPDGFCRQDIGAKAFAPSLPARSSPALPLPALS